MCIEFKNRQRYGLPMLLLALAVSVMACSHNTRTGPASLNADTGQNTVEQRLRRAAHTWEGTPHRLGGLDRNGIDCSGLVVRIYSDLFEVPLPRTTGALALAGRPVERRVLAPGDLVLFRLPENKQHVGIYLGRNEFVHTSAARGVTIARLDERYWRRTYWTSRRILN